MRREYWWIVAVDDTGQKYLFFGSDKGEEDARQKGLELGISDFEIKKYPTRRIEEASRILKYGVAERTHNIKGAMKRLRHQVKRNA